MKNDRIVQLDGLRTIAIVAVMIAHWLQWQWTETHPILSKVQLVRGVTLFFVLSGFLITQILLRYRDKYNQDSSRSKWILVKQFYKRRFLRIFPLYYAFIIILYLINYKNTQEIFPWLASYTTNIYQSFSNLDIGDFNHFWSLAVEEQFYLFWPLLLIFFKPSKTLSVILLTIFLSILLKFYFYFFTEYWMAISHFTLSCMYSLGLGALLAYLKIEKPELISRINNPKWLYLSIFGYLILFTIATLFEQQWYISVVDDVFFAIACFFIISIASSNGFNGISKLILNNKFIAYCGRISYGLYIFHLIVPEIFMPLAKKLGLMAIYNNNLLLFAVFFAITFLLAFISWNILEAPLNRLKDKLPYYKQAIEKKQ